MFSFCKSPVIKLVKKIHLFFYLSISFVYTKCKLKSKNLFSPIMNNLTSRELNTSFIATFSQGIFATLTFSTFLVHAPILFNLIEMTDSDYSYWCVLFCIFTVLIIFSLISDCCSVNIIYGLTKSFQIYKKIKSCQNVIKNYTVPNSIYHGCNGI